MYRHVTHVTSRGGALRHTALPVPGINHDLRSTEPAHQLLCCTSPPHLHLLLAARGRARTGEEPTTAPELLVSAYSPSIEHSTATSEKQRALPACTAYVCQESIQPLPRYNTNGPKYIRHDSLKTPHREPTPIWSLEFFVSMEQSKSMFSSHILGNQITLIVNTHI